MYLVRVFEKEVTAEDLRVAIALAIDLFKMGGKVDVISMETGEVLMALGYENMPYVSASLVYEA